MTFPTTSYVNARAIKNALDGTDASVNFSTNTFKVALFTNAVSGWDKNAAEAYGSGIWGTGNEVSSTGYTAGGITIASPTISTPAAGKWTWGSSAANVAWTGVSFTAGGAIVYNSSVSNRVLVVITFGGDQQVTTNTFTLAWDTTNRIFYSTF